MNKKNENYVYASELKAVLDAVRENGREDAASYLSPIMDRQRFDAIVRRLESHGFGVVNGFHAGGDILMLVRVLFHQMFQGVYPGCGPAARSGSRIFARSFFGRSTAFAWRRKRREMQITYEWTSL